MIAATARPLAIRPARLLAASRRSVVVKAEGTKVNLEIKKDEEKVVDTVDVSTIAKKAVFCRCWRSKKFPMCDGSHVKHNQATGDNVGPLIVEKKE